MWSSGDPGFWALTKGVVRGIDEDDLPGRASELAFNFLLAFFPLILFMLALFGLFASRSHQLQDSLLHYSAHFLPLAAFQLLKQIMIELAANATSGKLTLGIALALWFASGGMTSMISTLNAAYRVRESRSWVKVRVIALGLTLAISFLLLTSMLIALVGGHFVDWIGPKLHLRSVVVVFWKCLQWAASLCLVNLSFSLIYYCGPSLGKRRWYWNTPGSVFGTFLWIAASVAFRVYLHFFNTYTATYGSLGAVIILLVWLYVTGFAFLVGGKINAEIERAITRSCAQEDNEIGEVSADRKEEVLGQKFV
jgi:membrane protein